MGVEFFCGKRNIILVGDAWWFRRLLYYSTGYHILKGIRPLWHKNLSQWLNIYRLQKDDYHDKNGAGYAYIPLSRQYLLKERFILLLPFNRYLRVYKHHGTTGSTYPGHAENH